MLEGFKSQHRVQCLIMDFCQALHWREGRSAGCHIGIVAVKRSCPASAGQRIKKVAVGGPVVEDSAIWREVLLHKAETPVMAAPLRKPGSRVGAVHRQAVIGGRTHVFPPAL